MNLSIERTTSTPSLLTLVALVAGLSRGFSGIGAALIIMPGASSLVGAKLAAPILVIIDPVFARFLILIAFSGGDEFTNIQVLS